VLIATTKWAIERQGEILAGTVMTGLSSGRFSDEATNAHGINVSDNQLRLLCAGEMQGRPSGQSNQIVHYAQYKLAPSGHTA